MIAGPIVDGLMGQHFDLSHRELVQSKLTSWGQGVQLALHVLLQVDQLLSVFLTLLQFEESQLNISVGEAMVGRGGGVIAGWSWVALGI